MSAETSTGVAEDHLTNTSPRGRQGVRLAQRRPLACRACAKRKVRCDKIIPCAGCKKRGIQCTREEVVLSALSSQRKKVRAASSHSQPHDTPNAAPPVRASLFQQNARQDTNGHRNRFIQASPPAFDSNIHDNIGLRRSPPHVASRGENQGHHGEIRELCSNNNFPCVPIAVIAPRVHSVAQESDKGSPSQSLAQPEFEDIATGIEGLAWGRHQCHHYPHKACKRLEHPNTRQDVGLISDVDQEILSDVTKARELVDFHIRYLCWNHNVLHIPTFLRQCEIFWSSGVVEDAQWLPLYYAVLSSAAWSTETYPMYADEVFAVESDLSASKLFDMMIQALNNSNFMGRHTVFSIQAVCIAGMVGNVLGRSDLLTTLVNACIRIAQCLGLHRIPGDDEDESWDVATEKEVGRRVWWKLVEIDCHSMPYTGSCSINLQQFTTKCPSNCNDDDLVDKDESFLTTSTYSIIMAKIALLIPDLLDGIYNLENLAERYEHVIEIDRRMRQVVGKIPAVILRTCNEDINHKTEWLVVARRTLAIAAADKIIMIHRSFLVKSFQSPVYLFTRTTCVSAAMTILREHEQIAGRGFECPPIWLHSAFCVTAIVVICLNLLYCHHSMTSDAKLQHQTLINKARGRLSKCRNDTMARRGVLLIDAMLAEDVSDSATQDTPSSTNRPEFLRILNRFVQRDQEGKQVQASMPDMHTSASLPYSQVDDFDTWYNQMFG